MKKVGTCIAVLILLGGCLAQAQDQWVIKADKIDPENYYGITVANGMIGIVSSAEPFKVKNVVLAGAYDLYGRGRVSNFLNSFNLLNMYLEIDGSRVDAKNISNFKQELDMHMSCQQQLHWMESCYGEIHWQLEVKWGNLFGHDLPQLKLHPY